MAQVIMRVEDLISKAEDPSLNPIPLDRVPPIPSANVTGLGDIVSHNVAEFVRVANNLSDVASAAASRANLGLGTASTLNVGTSNGNVVQLGAGGLLPTVVLPPLAINDIFTVASQVAMLALTAQRGDCALRSDFTPNEFFMLAGDDPTQLANWKQVSIVNVIVNGKPGPSISLTTSDIPFTGLSTVSMVANLSLNFTGKSIMFVSVDQPDKYLLAPTGCVSGVRYMVRITNGESNAFKFGPKWNGPASGPTNPVTLEDTITSGIGPSWMFFEFVYSGDKDTYDIIEASAPMSVDTVNPNSVTLTAPTEGASETTGAPFTVVWTVDRGHGYGTVFLDGEPVNSGVLEAEITIPTDGSHTIQVILPDGAASSIININSSTSSGSFPMGEFTVTNPATGAKVRMLITTTAPTYAAYDENGWVSDITFDGTTITRVIDGVTGTFDGTAVNWSDGSQWGEFAARAYTDDIGNKWVDTSLGGTYADYGDGSGNPQADLIQIWNHGDGTGTASVNGGVQVKAIALDSTGPDVWHSDVWVPMEVSADGASILINGSAIWIRVDGTPDGDEPPLTP